MISLSKFLGAQSVTGYEYIDENSPVKGGNTDSRLLNEGDIYFALKGARSDGHDFIPHIAGKAAVSVVSASYKNENRYPVIYSSDTVRTMGEFSAVWRRSHKAEVTGITGSNGKTTTKEMLVKIFEIKYKVISTFKNFNNQIGVPLTLFSIKDNTEKAVVELGTNHFGEIKYLSGIADPDIALITNIGDAHLEALRSRHGVYTEKVSLFDHVVSKGGKILLNADDEYLRDYKSGNIITFGTKGTEDHYLERISLNDEAYPEFIFKGCSIRLKVPGLLNTKNALAAAAAAFECGVEPEIIAEGLSSYEPANNRYQIINFKNAKVISDCYNANPTSTLAFLDDISQMKGEFIVILGDMYELGENSLKFHTDIIGSALKYGFKKVFITGSEMRRAKENYSSSNNIYYFDDPAELRSAFMKEAEQKISIAVKGSRKMALEKLTEGEHDTKN